MTVRGERPLELEVTAACRGLAVRGLAADSARVAEAVQRVQSDTGKVQREDTEFNLAHAAPKVTFRYRIDLDALAASGPDLELAIRSGKSLLAPASSFLLYPLPLDLGVAIDVYLHAPKALSFATGLTPKGDHFQIEAHELGVATYSAFGLSSLQQHSLASGDASVSVALLDGKLDVSDAEIQAWVQRSADAVAKFYGRPPAPHTAVFVIPVPGAEHVVFGKLLPESAPGIAVLVGEHAKAGALLDDWVLVHELFHVGVPSFYREGKWFDEGLATYFEPVIRARAGLLSEAELWQSFAEEMPPALGVFRQRGLERARDYRELYWGGAVFCLVADVAARSATRGRLGLEDGVRRVLAGGGHASEVWSLDETLRLADSAFPAPLLAPLRKRYANGPADLDLMALLRDLGVEIRQNRVTLSDRAPLAWVRRAIVAGKRVPTSEPELRSSHAPRAAH